MSNEFFGKNLLAKNGKKVNSTIELCIFRFSLGTKFQFKPIILILRPNLPKNIISGIKQKKLTPSWNSAYSN